MAQLYLPLEHTDADLVLAGQIAETIDSAELYVTWTPGAGRAVPEVLAELRTAPLTFAETLGLVVEAVRDLWGALLGRSPQRAALPAAAELRAAQPKPAS